MPAGKIARMAAIAWNWATPAGMQAVMFEQRASNQCGLNARILAPNEGQ